jgi:hypothetical protein
LWVVVVIGVLWLGLGVFVFVAAMVGHI